MTTMRPPSTRNDSLKAIALGLLILAGGIVIGSSVTFLAMRPGDVQQQPPQPELFAQRMLGQLDRQLELTDEQRTRLKPLLEAHLAALDQIRQEARPRIVAQLEQLDADISDLLDEGQLQAWERNVQRLEEEFPTFRGRRGGGRWRSGGAEDDRGPHEPLGEGRRRNRTASE